MTQTCDLLHCTCPDLADSLAIPANPRSKMPGVSAYSQRNAFLQLTGTGYRVTAISAHADNLSDPGLDLSALPPPLVATAAGLNTALNTLLSHKAVQNTTSIGGRWELTRNSAPKLQFDHTHISDGSVGVLTNLQPDFQPGGEVNVISAAIDFVF